MEHKLVATLLNNYIEAFQQFAGPRYDDIISGRIFSILHPIIFNIPSNLDRSMVGRERYRSRGSRCISSFHWPSNISDPGNRETRYARGGQLLLRSIRRRILRGDVPLSKSSYLGEGASTGPCPSPLLSGKMEWFRSGIFFREGKEG